MILKSGSFEKMAQYIKNANKSIVLFGAGAIGTVVLPEILHELNLDNQIEGYIDNDSRRWGEKINCHYTVQNIYPPEYLDSLINEAVILLSISRYMEVLRQLEQLEYTKRVVCYIIPMMFIQNKTYTLNHGLIRDFENAMIPKKIHYMWLGKKTIPEKLQYCINSWKKYCPDYEIIRWDESNYDVFKNEYMGQAYEAGAYGFVPDYARLDILFQHGGIYLDTDVELLRNLDDLLYQEAFCSVEKWQLINFGGCSGSIKGSESIKKIIENRKQIRFINPDGSLNRNTCGYYDTQAVLKNGYKINGKNQKIFGMNIYASDYFHPYDYMSGIDNETENTRSIHYFDGGWLDETMRLQNKITKKRYIDLYKTCLN